MRRSGLVVSWLLLTAVPVFGQAAPATLAQYRQAIVTFAGHDFDGAAAMIANWPARDVKRLAQSVAVADEWLRSETAATFHTELALQSVASGQESAAALHLDIAEDIVQALPKRAHQRANLRTASNVPLPAATVEDIARFQQRWYAFAASLFLARTSPGPALAIVQRGLRLFRNNGQLRLLVGECEEMAAHIANGNLHDRTIISTIVRNPFRAQLTAAEDSYRRAIELDAKLAEAHLRLGRVLYLKKELPAARAELELARDLDAEPRVRYLAHLFLGALNAFEQDTGAARREYEAALALAPQHQTAYVALGFLESMSGRDARARELAGLLGGLEPAPEGDPWWNYQNGGLDLESLAWLRARLTK